MEYIVIGDYLLQPALANKVTLYQSVTGHVRRTRVEEMGLRVVEKVMETRRTKKKTDESGGKLKYMRNKLTEANVEIECLLSSN